VADLLSTVLVTVALVTVAGWAVDWIGPPWVAIAIGGAMIPDLGRLSLVVDPLAVEGAVGVPFDLVALETLGGLLVVAALITVWFDRAVWGRVYGLLVAGGLVHLGLDALRVFVDGHSADWLFPFLPGVRPSSPNLFVSSDPRVLVVAGVGCAIVLAVDRWVVAGDVWHS